MILDDKKNKGVNGFALLAFAIFIIVMFWVTGNLERKDNELSRKQFEKLVVSEDAKKITVVQNKNVPTGRVDIELRGEAGERGETMYLYVSDVNEIQKYLDKRDVDYDMPDVPQDDLKLMESYMEQYCVF